MKRRLLCKLEQHLGYELKPSRDTKGKIKKDIWRIPFELKQDFKGYLIVYCNYPYHPSILGNGKAKICLENNCIHLMKFRPEGRDNY